MDWADVVEVRPEAPLTLQVRFADGVSGKVCFEPTRFRGVFESLKDPALFGKAYVQDGYVAWPNGLDLAPDAMYDEIKAHGEWVLK